MPTIKCLFQFFALLFLMSSTLLLSPADACCLGGRITAANLKGLVPLNGTVIYFAPAMLIEDNNINLNAVTVIAETRKGGGPDPLVATKADVNVAHQHFYDQVTIKISPISGRWLPNTSYKVLYANDDLMASFQTSSQPDHKAPRWKSQVRGVVVSPHLPSPQEPGTSFRTSVDTGERWIELYPSLSTDAGSDIAYVEIYLLAEGATWIAKGARPDAYARWLGGHLKLGWPFQCGARNFVVADSGNLRLFLKPVDSAGNKGPPTKVQIDLDSPVWRGHRNT